MTARVFRTGAADRGAVIPIVALLLPVLMVMTGFAVDLGRQRADRRDMQAVADVVALDMSRLADGRTIAEIDAGGPAGQPPAATALLQSAARNGVDVTQLTLTWGTYAASTFTPMVLPTDVPDAAHIRAADTTDFYFQPGSGDVSREAVAQLGRLRRAEFLLGSTLVSVTPSQSWFLGQLLSSIVPGADLIGYQGLANAQLTLGDLAADLGVGSVEELLALEVTFEELLLATAEGLSRQGNTVGLAVIEQLLDLQVEDATVRMGDVLGLDTTDDAGLVGAVAVPQLLSTGAVLAGGSNFISVPSSVVNLAGLGTLGIKVHVIEGPIRVGTADGASGTTKQVGIEAALAVDTNGTANQDVCKLPSPERDLLASLISGLLGGLSCLLGPINRVVGARVAGTIDLDLSIAGVTASQAIRCDARHLDIAYSSGPLTVVTAADLAATATVAGTPVELLGISVPAGPIAAAAGPSGTRTFEAMDVGPIHVDFEDVATGLPTARVGGTTLGLANLLQVNGFDVTVVNQSLPVVGALAKNLVAPTLNGILAGLDTFLVSEISRLLGLNLGGADITPLWMDCDDDGSVNLVE